MHEQYKETLFDTEQLWHGMNILRSEGHEIYGMHQNKISLSPFHSKRWIANYGIHTKAYGYTNMPIWPLLTDDELRELDLLLRGNCVFGGTTSSSSRTKARLEPSRKE